MGIVTEHGVNQISSGNGMAIRILNGVAIAILVALIIGIFQFNGWRGEMNQRVTTIEAKAEKNQNGVETLTQSINENTRVTAVLAERMQAIIMRMDERSRRNEQ